MTLSLIVATAENDVIGRKGALPWSLPDDLRYFRTVTKGHPVIMGRKTFESIGRPLPDRLNIVLSSQHRDSAGCTVVRSLADAIETAEQSDSTEAFIIGGREVFADALEHHPVNRMYLTRVHANIEGDVMLPTIDWSQWKQISARHHDADDAHPYPFTFFVYERMR